MTGTVLLAIFIVVVVAVVAVLAWLGLRGWRLFKTVNRAQAELVPLADGLSQRGMLAGEKAERISARSVEMQQSIASLQASIQRFTVLVQAFQEANGRWGSLKRLVR